jgi:hypothetical protein
LEKPNRFDATTSGEICHIEVAIRDTSTMLGSPVRSRLNSALAMAPATASPPITSPKAGAACPIGQPSRSGITAAMPAWPSRKCRRSPPLGVGPLVPCRSLAMMMSAGPQVVVVDLQLAAHLRQVVGEEHVGGLDQLQSASAVGAEVDGHRLFPWLGCSIMKLTPRRHRAAGRT